jgi:serine/threonine protein kinase
MPAPACSNVTDASRERSMLRTSGSDRASVTLLQAGAGIGRYGVVRCVGAGSMGIVYEARDPELGRRVALKLVRNDSRAATRSRGGQTRLLREARALARVSHPNVIAIYDVGTCPAGAFLAMELVAGGTLEDWLSLPRSWREILRVLRGAGEGLAAAHEAGVVHRDFKPANVLVGRDGRARVSDFGLASLLDDPEAAGPAPAPAPPDSISASTRSGTLVGTPAYMAPEAIRGETVDARSDVFSFCTALYGALYGERPFAGSTVGDVWRATLKGAVRPAPRPCRVPGWLRRIVVGGLQADPDKRPETMRALLDAIDERSTDGLRGSIRRPSGELPVGLARRFA